MTTGSSGAEHPGMEQLIGKAIGEPEFRQQLIDNPEQAVRSAGIQLTQEEMQALTSSSREEREQMMTQLSERTSPAVCTFWSLVWVKVCILNSWLRV